MNKLFILLLLVSTTTLAQTTVGVMGGRTLNMDKDMIGLSLNQKWDSTDISTGIIHGTNRKLKQRKSYG